MNKYDYCLKVIIALIYIYYNRGCSNLQCS